MKKSLTLVSVVTALAVWSSPAAADAIPHGTIALGAERLTGFTHSKDSVGPVDTTRDKFTLLGQDSKSPTDEPAGNAYDLPRIGIDGFIIDGLSIGGTLGILHTSRTDKTTLAGITASVDSSETGILFAPRVGYGFMFSEHIGIWPRGGFSYFTTTNDVDNLRSINRHYFSLNIDVPFLFKLAPNFAITAGPTIDVGLDGSQKTEPVVGPSSSVDASYAAFGITAGLVALL